MTTSLRDLIDQRDVMLAQGHVIRRFILDLDEIKDVLDESFSPAIAEQALENLRAFLEEAESSIKVKIEGLEHMAVSGGANEQNGE